MPHDADRARLRAIQDVSQVETTGGVTRIFVANAGRALGPIAAVIADGNQTVDRVAVHPVNLERVFLHLTGKALRD